MRYRCKIPMSLIGPVEWVLSAKAWFQQSARSKQDRLEMDCGVE